MCADLPQSVHVRNLSEAMPSGFMCSGRRQYEHLLAEDQFGLSDASISRICEGVKGGSKPRRVLICSREIFFGDG